MSVFICKGCGGTTNSTTCDYIQHKDYQPRKCYVKWENGKPIKGCGYDELKEKDLEKSKGKYVSFELKFCSDILKGRK